MCGLALRMISDVCCTKCNMPDSATAENDASSTGLFRRAPVLTTLALIAFVNWCVFFGVSMHFGGYALGIRPSTDGFVVKSHGHKTAVTEKVWLFSVS